MPSTMEQGQICFECESTEIDAKIRNRKGREGFKMRDRRSAERKNKSNTCFSICSMWLGREKLEK